MVLVLGVFAWGQRRLRRGFLGGPSPCRGREVEDVSESFMPENLGAEKVRQSHLFSYTPAEQVNMLAVFGVRGNG